MTTITKARSFYIPYTDADNEVYLVPKGTQVIARRRIREQKNSRTVVLVEGTYTVAYVRKSKVTLFDSDAATYIEKELYYYVVLMEGALIVINPDQNDALESHNGDPLHDETTNPDTGQEWGWYGLDWTNNDEDSNADDAGYVALRRMIRPVRR